jgi:hypothetical protein
VVALGARCIVQREILELRTSRVVYALRRAKALFTHPRAGGGILKQAMSRRTFKKQFAAVAAATAVMPHTALSQKSRDVHIGHTGIAILDLIEGRQLQGMVMAELDDSNACSPDPTPPHQLVSETVSYLKTVGVKLRT